MLKISQDELKKYYNDNKTMIWNYKTLYQINYSINAGYYLMQIYKRLDRSPTGGVTLRGRYIPMHHYAAMKYTAQG